ncbi:RBBP9/YdeN family alpha/beta hydrolase [Aeromonas hydrophila]|uniref:RBBP9/YdeN family alpha/beta hydrolase n=1 Tax=Aeromonas hydrophila TaxID=644 RepID=UPI003989D73E
MSHTRVFIVHGYTASPHSHWFPWLKAQLEARDIRVEVLAMPDPHHPQPAAWDAVMDSLVRDHDERTFLLGHSLGCITILRQLSRLPASRRVGGILLVSGFDQPLHTLPELDPFMTQGYEPAHIMALAPRRVVVASRDDAIVPYRYCQHLSEQLAAPLYSLEHGGHFLDRDGFLALPLVHDRLLGMIEDQ